MKEILLQPIFEVEEEIALSGAATSRGAAAGRVTYVSESGH